MIRPVFLVGFAGHRNLADPDGVRAVLRENLLELRGRAEEVGGALEYYGSIAYGSDTIAAEECRELGIPVHLVLPKPVITTKDGSGEVDRWRGFAADFWDGDPRAGGSFREADWKRAFRQIEDARIGVDGGTLRVAASSQTDPECYYETGLRLLDACDLLLAVWDGYPAEGLGGTGDMIEYARHHDLPVVIVPPDGDRTSVTAERPEGFARSDDAGVETMREVEAYCCEAEGAGGGGGEGEGRFFDRLDACSLREARSFRNSLVKIIFAHGLATLVAAIAAVLPQTPLAWKVALAGLALVEFIFVFWALRRARKLHHKQTHERWMRTRFAAELMRGIRDARGLLDPLHPLIARHKPEWRRFAVTAGLDLRRGGEAPLDWREARDSYVDERLSNANWRHGQIGYFSEKQATASYWFKLTRQIGTWLGRLALLFVAGALVYKAALIAMKLDHQPVPPALSVTDGWVVWPWLFDFAFKLMPIALPLAAGVFISLRAALDAGRRTYRYGELAERMEAAAVTVAALKTETAVRRIVAATEEVLLDEVIEWHLAEQQNGAH